MRPAFLARPRACVARALTAGREGRGWSHSAGLAAGRNEGGAFLRRGMGDRRPGYGCLSGTAHTNSVPKRLIEGARPGSPGEDNTSRLVHLPIIDRPTIKKQMASIAPKSFLAELTALQKDLERFIAQASAATKKGKPGTIRRDHGGAAGRRPGHEGQGRGLRRDVGDAPAGNRAQPRHAPTGLFLPNAPKR